MWTQSPETADPKEKHGSDETDRLSRPRRALSTVARRGRYGTAVALAGGTLLADAVRTARRDRRRAGVIALVGGALLGVGLRQRRLEDGTSTAGGDEATGSDGTHSTGADDGARKESAEARAHRERSDVLHQPETNPRGVSGEPDVETETDPDEGDVRFATEQEAEEAEPKPHLDGDEGDPRLHDEDDPETTDDSVEVSLSEAAMADEASEATGPDPEQSYPASEGTDPEPMSEKAPERREEGAVANADSDDEGGRTDDDPGEATDADGEETTDDKTMDDEETP